MTVGAQDIVFYFNGGPLSGRSPPPPKKNQGESSFGGIGYGTGPSPKIEDNFIPNSGMDELYLDKWGNQFPVHSRDSGTDHPAILRGSLGRLGS